MFTDNRCIKFIDDPRCTGNYKAIKTIMLISYILEIILCSVYIIVKCNCMHCYKQLSRTHNGDDNNNPLENSKNASA